MLDVLRIGWRNGHNQQQQPSEDWRFDGSEWAGGEP
jgi:hypothetical protein